MAPFLSSLLTASLHGSIVILAVILLRLLLRNTPKKFICLLWLLAGIRLLMPFEIRSDLSLQPEPGPRMQEIIMQEATWQEAPEEQPYAMAPVQPEVQTPEDTAIVPAVTPNAAEPESPVQPATIVVVEKPAFSWRAVLPWVWLGVASTPSR